MFIPPVEKHENFADSLRAARQAFLRSEKEAKAAVALQRFLCLCRYLVLNLDSQDLKASFIVIAFSKDHLLSWVSMVKTILHFCCLYLNTLRPDMPSDTKFINIYLHSLTSYTTCNNWQALKTKQGEPFKAVMAQLCSKILDDLCADKLYSTLHILLKKGLARDKPSLKPVTFSTIFNLSMRPLVIHNLEHSLFEKYLTNILTIPAYIHHLNSLAYECSKMLTDNKVFEHCLTYVGSLMSKNHENQKLDVNRWLFLFANVISLAFMDKENLLEHLLDFTQTSNFLLDKCSQFAAGKKTNMAHFHPILGWLSQPVEIWYYYPIFLLFYQESLPFVREQLKILWSGESIKLLFGELSGLQCSSSDQNNSQGNAIRKSSFKAANLQKFLHKVFDQKLSLISSTASSQQYLQKFGSPETTLLAVICSLYHKIFTTFKQTKYEVLSGLCYQDFLLPRLWRFISQLSPHDGLKAYIDLLIQNPKATSPEFQILNLFADCSTYLILILDDLELYEQQKPFSLDDLRSISKFCNYFVYKSVMEGIVDAKTMDSHALFCSMVGLLSLLHARDARRNFAETADFWLIKDIKPSNFLSELEKGTSKKFEVLLRKAPHILPHKDRIILFRKFITLDKETIGLSSSTDFFDRPSTSITVHRSRLIEDGYRQLSVLSSKALKGIIRVKFINEQGLDEPGIDQDGVFKEFLEETIKRIFDPSLNLFKLTSESRLYPSSTSYIHENHLTLFEFVGRILGKAVYEGIVVEIPFALFVLNHILGRVNSRIYSSVDLLPSLDPELYKSLTYIKHYDGNVRDLDLTFSLDEDCMGQMVTHELVPGGKSLFVTDDNKISYIHLMAHFRLYVQIKDQLNAFVRGFRSLINPEWLMLFSAPELQTLISGDNEDIDLKDLKQNVQYYGGFHSNHRVIIWLWDILENNFTIEERRLFLKFVTSCSKPPLLGFANLVPPFSIRCVEVADDQIYANFWDDEGDTLGSVIRGFLAIRKKDPVGRLPTASTCFNLLKLPNYQKKSTLRDKLRYAIKAGSGFELS
uniref:Ubiquitin-protein ligase E3B n=1 Tax=Romanomermis culicivorax TaxID=13658 RepID=A0A915K9A7_ROMCU